MLGERPLYSQRSDVFSLGCILYKLCTGRRPYPREELPRGWPEPISEAHPESLCALIIQCIRPPTSERPDSAQVVERLVAILADMKKSGSWPSKAVSSRLHALGKAVVVRRTNGAPPATAVLCSKAESDIRPVAGVPGANGAGEVTMAARGGQHGAPALEHAGIRPRSPASHTCTLPPTTTTATTATTAILAGIAGTSEVDGRGGLAGACEERERCRPERAQASDS